MSIATDAGQLREANAASRATYDPRLGVAQSGSTPYATPSGQVAVPANGFSRIAGPEGVAYGFQGGHARNASEVLKMRNDARTSRNVARVNMAYGHLPSMRDNNVYATALGNNALIHGEIEHSAGLTRDATSAANVGDSEANARAASFRASESGTAGSSTDIKNRRRVLGSFLGGRATTAAATGGLRRSATNAIEQERLGTIDNVKGKSGINLGERIADLSTIRQLGEAQKQVIPSAIGQGIGDMGQLYANSMLYGQVNRGLPSNASLPSLSGGTTKASGGFTYNPSTGR